MYEFLKRNKLKKNIAYTHHRYQLECCTHGNFHTLSFKGGITKGASKA
jgi:hypothetical protein